MKRLMKKTNFRTLASTSAAIFLEDLAEIYLHIPVRFSNMAAHPMGRLLEEASLMVLNKSHPAKM